ncbi:FMN reductase [Streptomyces aculeolatus]|uniref:CE1759 family FMN reductase n=1 Tax=Streptomyces aculeolatus TaxID=270689 RepID=UPI001CECAC55|nr:CE1759 family FMN reductase [Streptomyces aculeolatus]
MTTERKIVVINAGVSEESSTRRLAGRIAQQSIDTLGAAGIPATVTMLDLGPLATEIARSLVSGFPTGPVSDAIARLADADAVVAATPVYKAGISGLFKSFADLIDNDLLIAVPVVLAATGGTARHAMVTDDQLRPLFAFLRALPVPTSLYAAPEDWGSPELGKRIARAAGELAALLRTDAPRQIADDNWGGYRHRFAGQATRAEQGATDVDFDTDLMRLATGGPAS